MKKENWTWYIDPGHSWLKVPTADLIESGVADKISKYSYQSRDGSVVYLEEDIDAIMFLEATGYYTGERQEELNTKDYNTECFVRQLPKYNGGIL